MRPLPPVVVEVLRDLDASPRLLAHLLVVHDVAAQLVEAVHRAWPRLRFDATELLVGAAAHDVGKALHPEEIAGPGNRHLDAGTRLLEQRGFSPRQARYARTHETWAAEPDATIEDLLVALADELWRGTRDQALEEALTERIAAAVQDTPWAVYMDLDDIAMSLAEVGPARMQWLMQFDAPDSTSSTS